MKRLNNIAGHKTIQEYAKSKILMYEKKEKSFATLFEIMFSERDNIMAEITDGYRIKKLTYGQFKDWILEVYPSVKAILSDAKRDAVVGIYMNNSMEWLVAFWSVLASGCRPLLLNTRLDDTTINSILTEHSVYAVISDSKQFDIKTYIAKDILVKSSKPLTPDSFGTEVIFMSSGTTESIKLCSYTGENFYYQIRCSTDIITECPDIAEHYEGELRQLALLPFYHVFGFIAVYLWFGFFGRSFVFLRDMNPSTILNTVRKHKVTHIFAVPLVWDTTYREAMRKIKARGDKTYNSFCKALRICNKTGKLGNFLSRKLLSEVRDNLFGPSIKFMISGGSAIDTNVLEFFNGIGYPLVNGYGMTEVGITSVEMRQSKKFRNLCSVGQPFSHVEYSVSDNAQLLIKSRAMASRITVGNKVYETDLNEYFNSHDLAEYRDGGHYLLGRSDDLIVCESGENINPMIAEGLIKAEVDYELCIFNSDNGPVLVASVPDCYNEDALTRATAELNSAVKKAKLANEIRRIAVTPMSLMDENDFKISRRKLCRRYEGGELLILTPDSLSEYKRLASSELEYKIVLCFAQVLDKSPADISVNADFYNDLGGSSLDYFMLKEKLKENLDLQINENDNEPTTVNQCKDLILKGMVNEYV